MSSVLIAALYHFVPLADAEHWHTNLKKKCQDLEIKGILLVAQEGINGTLAGQPDHLRQFLDFLRSHEEFKELQHKESWHDQVPFTRLAVRLKTEIVTMRQEQACPLDGVGTYVPPRDWNALITDPDTVVIDTRNNFEYAFGTFQGAVDPHTNKFTDFPEWIQSQENISKDTKLAMFCTGGIRCERATAYLKQQGYKNVYHLQGGILKYLEEIPKEESLWQGECFVFDQRIALDHNLKSTGTTFCNRCSFPLWGPDFQCENCATENPVHTVPKGTKPQVYPLKS